MDRLIVRKIEVVLYKKVNLSDKYYDLKKYCEEHNFKYYYTFHDLLTDNEHCHFIISANKTFDCNSISNKFAIPLNNFQKIKDLVSAIRYQIHFDNPDKEQLSIDCICSNDDNLKDYFKAQKHSKNAFFDYECLIIDYCKALFNPRLYLKYFINTYGLKYFSQLKTMVESFQQMNKDSSFAEVVHDIALSFGLDSDKDYMESVLVNFQSNASKESNPLKDLEKGNQK